MSGSFDAAGGFAWALVLVTALLVTLSIACAVLRARRIVAVALLLAGLLPFGIGMLGVLAGRQQVLRTTAALVAPTERDLHWGRASGHACLVLGIAATIVCAAAALGAISRARKPPADRDPHPRMPAPVWNA